MFATQDTLNWNVEARPMVAIGEAGRLINIPGKVAQVRDDNQEVIGITAPSYSTYQNEDFKNLIYPLVDEGLLEITEMGYLKGGSKVFIQATMTQGYKAAGDEVKGMITLLNSHDGSASLAAGVTTQRVICTNTFAMAMSDMGARLRHTAAIYDKAQSITAITDYVNENMRIYSEAADALALKRCDDQLLDVVIENAYGKPTENVRAYNKIVGFYRNGLGTEGKTMWDAVNAVTQYTSHEAVKDDAKRFGSVNFGRNAIVNRKAFEMALAIAS